ncbi:MAG: hypothetical protein KGD67_05765 [Candidatus Lokiarchaeota archaeon]|nr:hypothetical protein [Candidatus Lokiarchaeota archaeon]
MTSSKEEVLPILSKFPKYKIFEELKEDAVKEVKQALEKEKEIDPIQKKRDERNWKTSLGYYSLNPNKFDFKISNLKTKK